MKRCSKPSIITEIHFITIIPKWSMVKNPSAKQETRVQSLGWEDSLEEDMVTYSSILAWRIAMDRGAWWASAHGVAESDTTEVT